MLALSLISLPFRHWADEPTKLLFDDKAVQCLAKNVYHEARGEPTRGQLAVALVTLNRTYHDKFPSSVCSVVYEKSQFSWTNKKLKVRDIKAWERAKDVAYKAIAEYDKFKHFKATHFHSTAVNPGWKLKRV